MGGQVQPFFATNKAGGMLPNQRAQPVSDQHTKDQAVAMAIALADCHPQKTDSDAALALHLALNDQPEGNTVSFRGDALGAPASPPASSASSTTNRAVSHG